MFFWFIIGGSILAVILAVVGFYMAVRQKAIFGTESHRVRDLSGLTPTGETPPSGGTREAIFGTESNQFRDVSELAPTKAD